MYIPSYTISIHISSTTLNDTAHSWLQNFVNMSCIAPVNNKHSCNSWLRNRAVNLSRTTRSDTAHIYGFRTVLWKCHAEPLSTPNINGFRTVWIFCTTLVSLLILHIHGFRTVWTMICTTLVSLLILHIHGFRTLWTMICTTLADAEHVLQNHRVIMPYNTCQH